MPLTTHARTVPPAFGLYTREKTQSASLRTTQSLTGLNLGQALIITVGITLSLALAAKEVLDERMTVGDFVLVNTYILQLYTPLNFLGTYYRMIKQCMVDVEAMFKLLRENQEVADAPGAPELILTSPSQASPATRNTIPYTLSPRLWTLISKLKTLNPKP